MKYNTNDLMRARYTYSYTIDERINVIGERDGILYFQDDVYVDLITESIVSEEDIIKKQCFNARDNEVSLSSIIKIFESLEDYYEIMAIERQVGDIYNEIPSVVTFKASEMHRALESMFNGFNKKEDTDTGIVKKLVDAKNKIFKFRK